MPALQLLLIGIGFHFDFSALGSSKKANVRKNHSILRRKWAGKSAPTPETTKSACGKCTEQIVLTQPLLQQWTACVCPKSMKMCCLFASATNVSLVQLVAVFEVEAISVAFSWSPLHCRQFWCMPALQQLLIDVGFHFDFSALEISKEANVRKNHSILRRECAGRSAPTSERTKSS